jgi:hypothetical protein
VIKRHTSARGGAARLDVVHALSTDVAITEKGSTLQAHYSCNDSPAWRIDVYAQGQHVFCEGLDEAGPWLWPAGDSSAHQAVPDAKKTGIQGIEFNLLDCTVSPSVDMSCRLTAASSSTVSIITSSRL